MHAPPPASRWKKDLLWFAALQCCMVLLMFRGALWGSALLAPLDIAPALFSKFSFVDPNAPPLPANHYTIDQILADVPLQHTIHGALRRGEIPWWDPYTYGGMPLLADGHANGTDPIRLAVYSVLPFELAYNWTLILQCVVTGLGMFLLLRQLGFALSISLLLAVAYEFAGGFTVHFMHPWIRGAFAYYPFIWMAWDNFARTRRARWLWCAVISIAASIMAGSVQTDSYLVLFALCFCAGWCGRDYAAWRALSPIVVMSGILGVGLAAPVLCNQVELFLSSVRPVGNLETALGVLRGPASLAGIFPWVLGTFRTLDLGKFFGGYGNSLGFNIFIGSLAFIMAVCGLRAKPASPSLLRAKKISVLLVAAYVVILSTPLFKFFYARCAPLALMGLCILAAAGITQLRAEAKQFPRAGRTLLAGALALACLLHVAAFVIYPRIMPRVLSYVTERQKTNTALDYAPALREAQVKRLPREISFQNPEALIAWLGIVAAAMVLLRPKWRAREETWALLLALNLVPVLLFSARYSGHVDVALWRRLLEGGPEQRRIAAELANTPLRLHEIAVGRHEQAMPCTIAHLYRVRVVDGYSALPPLSIGTLARRFPNDVNHWTAQAVDYTYEAAERGAREGVLRKNSLSHLGRFYWRMPVQRPFTVQDQGLNRVRVEFSDGPSAELIWTDTWFPGWRATVNGTAVPLRKEPPCFSSVSIAPGRVALVLEYRPRLLHAAICISVAAMIVTLAWSVIEARRRAASPDPDAQLV
jgi:hypothetical protein